MISGQESDKGIKIATKLVASYKVEKKYLREHKERKNMITGDNRMMIFRGSFLVLQCW
jgi:hypothetical protein